MHLTVTAGACVFQPSFHHTQVTLFHHTLKAALHTTLLVPFVAWICIQRNICWTFCFEKEREKKGDDSGVTKQVVRQMGS